MAEEEKNVSTKVTLDRFNFLETDETCPKNENWQLHEYCMLETLRKSCATTKANSA